VESRGCTIFVDCRIHPEGRIYSVKCIATSYNLPSTITTRVGLLEKENVSVIGLHLALPGAFDGVHSIQGAFDAVGRGEIEHSGV